jgi:hypothetical protein
MSDFVARNSAPNSFPLVRGNSRADIEAGFGVDPIQVLQAQLEATTEKWAQGAALYGAGGFANDVRKKVLSLAMLRIRNDYLNRGEKAPTEKVLDAMAHADKDYTRWLDQQVIDRAEWLQLSDTRDNIREMIRRDDALIRAAGRV